MAAAGFFSRYLRGHSPCKENVLSALVNATYPSSCHTNVVPQGHLHDDKLPLADGKRDIPLHDIDIWIVLYHMSDAI